MLSAVAAPDTGPDDLLAAAFAAVRPEFRGPIVRIDADDPVFGAGPVRRGGL